MAAVDMAVKGLRTGDYDIVICGGADQMMAPPSFVKFSKIGALSPDGSRPFDAKANGFALILKKEDTVLYAQTAYDVTDGVLKLLNSKPTSKP
jgi:acetyl-CoA acetyltransferase